MINHNVSQRFEDSYHAIIKESKKLLGNKTAKSLLTLGSSFVKEQSDSDFLSLVQTASKKLDKLIEKLEQMNKSKERNERLALKNKAITLKNDMDSFIN